MTITRIVKMTFKPEHIDDFANYYNSIKGKVAGQPGCNGVKLLKEIEGSGVFFTYSNWDSVNDLNNYRNTKAFAEIWPTVKDWFAVKAEAWSLNEK